MLRKIDKPLLIVSTILFIVGLVMIFSASNVTSFMQQSRSTYYYFTRQLLIFIGTVIVCFVIIRFDTKFYGKISWVFMFIFTALLIFVLIYGKLTNQARSWIEIVPGFKIQPSEFMKVIGILWMSSYCTIIKKNENYKFFIPLLCLIVVMVTILIMLQPDFGTAFIYFIIMFLMFWALPLSKHFKKTVLIVLASIIGVGLLLLINNGVKVFLERQLERFDYFNPCSEEKFYDSGTQVCNSFIAFNNGGFLGKGLGNSTQKYLYLPEAYTDFIFAIIVEELGFLGGAVILIMLGFVLWRIFIIGKRAKTNENRIICYGVFIYILLHIVINLGGITGSIPLTGVPLPFLSYGGSFLMCLVVSLTLVQRVSIENNG